jgi:non-ribosomal peptide synthetase component E (peptide arylation enzyme)
VPAPAVGDLTIPGLVRRAAHDHGDREAVVDEDGATRLDFRQLEDVMISSTRAVMAAGLEPGDRASIWASSAPAVSSSR